jgi:hypothetical protein
VAAGGLLTIRVPEDDFRGTLDEQSFFARGGLVERRHEFMFRFERDGSIRGKFVCSVAGSTPSLLALWELVRTMHLQPP